MTSPPSDWGQADKVASQDPGQRERCPEAHETTAIERQPKDRQTGISLAIKEEDENGPNEKRWDVGCEPGVKARFGSQWGIKQRRKPAMANLRETQQVATRGGNGNEV